MNSSLNELVKIIGVNYDKYNQKEKGYIEEIMVLLTENEVADEVREIYLAELFNVLNELNPLLDKDDVKSTTNRSIIDGKMLYLSRLTSSIVSSKKESIEETDKTEDKEEKNVEVTEADEVESEELNKNEVAEDPETVAKISALVVSELNKDGKSDEVTGARIANYFDDKNKEEAVVDASSKEDKEENTNVDRRIRIEKGILVVSSVALLLSLFATGYAIIKSSKTGKIKEPEPTPNPKSNVDVDTTDRSNDYDSETNVLVVDYSGILEADKDYVPLTTENFENLVGEYAYKYNDVYDDVVTTQDIIKFGVIANINQLSEDNRELVGERVGNQAKEEYLGDAAKIIGVTVQHNAMEWNKTSSTDGFVRVSNVVYGSQKDKMLKIEEYVDKIADAVNAKDSELVNSIISEFLTEMSSGSLSKLDDGVGFVAQVNIAIIADCIARDYLNQENFDMFQILKTSEKYVSNIFTKIEGCANTEVKTLTKTN